MVSVIIPAYIPSENHHMMLLRALKSLEQQSYNGFEVVCVLNGCYTACDRIADTLKSNLLDVKLIQLEGKASGAIARNIGVKHCQFELIAQLDADDQYHPDKIKKQIKFFKLEPDHDFVGTLAWDFHSPKDVRESCYSSGQYMTHDQISKAILKENVMCHSSVMFKKKSFEALGGYNEKINLVQYGQSLVKECGKTGISSKELLPMT